LKLTNPLRYPGSKASFASSVGAFVTACGYTGFEIVEPFAGSASVSIDLVSSGVCSKAILIERDPLLYAFWSAVFFDTRQLCNRISKLTVDLGTWHNLRPLLAINSPDEYELIDLAVAGLFFNRTNFSGVLHAGPIGGQQQKSVYKVNCRFNKEDLIARIRAIAKLQDRIEVIFSDALGFLEKQKEVENRNRFYYVDPPYFVQGEKLYRYSFDLSQHKQLAKALCDLKSPWLLSYDRHPVIEMLYERYASSGFEFKYSSKTRKIEREFLVTNIKLPKNLSTENPQSKPSAIHRRRAATSGNTTENSHNLFGLIS
jgi:DNA adenine methylase